MAQLSGSTQVLSFYKIFGYPTGLGALVARKDALALLRPRYFGGGTAAACAVDEDFFRCACAVVGQLMFGEETLGNHAVLVDGTAAACAVSAGFVGAICLALSGQMGMQQLRLNCHFLFFVATSQQWSESIILCLLPPIRWRLDCCMYNKSASSTSSTQPLRQHTLRRSRLHLLQENTCPMQAPGRTGGARGRHILVPGHPSAAPRLAPDQAPGRPARRRATHRCAHAVRAVLRSLMGINL